MDGQDSSRNVFDRIQQFEPELAARIVGYLLFKESNKQILQLCYGSDKVVLASIQEAKAYLRGSIPHPSPSTSTGLPPHYSPRELFSHASSSSSSSPSSSYCTPRLQYPTVSPSYTRNPRLLALGRSVKPCHYFYKGYCKHENNCELYHVPSFRIGTDPRLLRRELFCEAMNEDNQMLSPYSLLRLEEEIRQLLIFRGGKPIPIAMLPGLYYEMYGNVLQGDGCLTERQSHGHAEYNLMKLLVRLTNGSLQLIDGPHRQHSVALAEDAAMTTPYMEQRHDKPKSNVGEIVDRSDQIYLTFRPDSTFTEVEIARYFSRYGQVEAVRFPAQIKRMFGYVHFANAETMEKVLLAQNPHYVDGACILVKPYRARCNLERSQIPTLDNSTTRNYNYRSMECQTSPDPLPRPYGFQSAFNYSGWHASRLMYQSRQQQQQQPFELQLDRDSPDDKCLSLYDDFSTLGFIEQVLMDDEKEVDNVVQSRLTGDCCANQETSGDDVVVNILHCGSPEVEGDSKKEDLD